MWVLLGVSLLSDEHYSPLYTGFSLTPPPWVKESAIVVECFEKIQLADPAKAMVTVLLAKSLQIHQ